MFVVPVTRRSVDFTRQFERLLDDGLERFFTPAAAEVSARSPVLDVTETESGYTAVLDLPGVAKQDVQVSVEGRRVSVSAQSQAPEAAQINGDAKPAPARVLLRERSQARFARSFTLPAEVDPAEVQARLDNGVLTLQLPKRAARSAAQITIN
jgi:HSP20 family protein